MGNYIEGTCKKFPSTNFSHFPTHAHGLHYLLLISPNHSFFFFSFPRFPRLFNLKWLRCSLQFLFSSFSSSSSFVFSLSHRLCLMPSSCSFFFPFFFISFFFSSQILCCNFFFLDFSSKFVWHKNFEGVLDIAWGCSYFFFVKGKQIKKIKLLYINFFFQVRVFLGTPWTLSGVATKLDLLELSPL